MRFIALGFVGLLSPTLLSTGVWALTVERPPNVIVILTDDQGYGEVAAHGNPVIQTPHLDKLFHESVRLTNFHTDPTCSPTRAALLTGRYSTRAGVWHTINGRSLLPPDELTLAEVFQANGYRTAMIGKWHLGDNLPCRPQDQGFDHSVWHLGGGIGNGPDFWGNDYFDDTYRVNGEAKEFEGYCTDVWFHEAKNFVQENRDHPFFLYLSTNAPHGPYHVPDAYAQPYRDLGLPKEMANFYGMITNIDENLGSFRSHLVELGLAENTLLIFLTDNGTTAGWIDQAAQYPYFNAGMRGWKGSAWEGGHRVPCFWHWPAGDLADGRDVPSLTAHFDLLPTLVELLGLTKPEGPPLDGLSLAAHLRGQVAADFDRTLFVHVQRAFLPPKWQNSAVLTPRWRLLNGQELYDIVADPGQQHDIASDHPETVQHLRDAYEQWWKSLEPSFERTVRHVLGGEENPLTLHSHDWLMPGVEQAAWHQSQIQRGAVINGPWPVEVQQAGTYEITLYRWPAHLHRPMGRQSARLSIGDMDATLPLDEQAPAATFRVELPAGPALLQTWLTQPDGQQHGAYFTQVHRLTD